VGLSGESITFPNRAAAETDFYGGIRPTFGNLALDLGRARRTVIGLRNAADGRPSKLSG
jgi:hypothetical protein